MTSADKVTLEILITYVVIAVICGTSFGLWQGSGWAGGFMTVFSFIMLKEK